MIDSNAVQILGPSIVPGTKADGSGFQIGDGIFMTAGHVAYEYNMKFSPSKWQSITDQNVVSSLNDASLRVVLDTRGYRAAYTAELRTQYQGADVVGVSAPDNEKIEGKYNVYRADMVFVKGGGKVNSGDPGMVTLLTLGIYPLFHLLSLLQRSISIALLVRF